MASKKSKNTGMILVLLIVSAVGGALMGAYVMTAPGARYVAKDLRTAPNTVSAKQPATQDTGKLMIPRPDKGPMFFDSREVSIPKGQDARVYLVNEYLRQLSDKGLGSKDGRALGVDVRDGVAYLDVNKSFEDTMNGLGTNDEATLLNGILSTLGQFPEINKVQFEVDGKAMVTSGDQDLTQPLDVIRPGQAPEASTPASGQP